MPTGMLPPLRLWLSRLCLPTLSVATPTSGRGRLRPSLVMATDVEATVAVATDVADTARGRLRPAMAMAVEAMVDAAMVATDVADTARGRPRLSLAMAAMAVEVTEAAATAGTMVELM